MKFTGLILICASSVLALLLPAIGVVKFPMVHRTAMENSPTVSDRPSLPGSPSLSAAPSGLPVSAPGFSGSESLESASQDVPLLGPPWTKQKLGLSAWVFLAPVMLLGLGLWTFAPNRRGVGR